MNTWAIVAVVVGGVFAVGAFVMAFSLMRMAALTERRPPWLDEAYRTAQGLDELEQYGGTDDD